VVRLRTLTLSAVGGKDLSQVSRPLQLAHCRSEIPRFLMIVNSDGGHLFAAARGDAQGPGSQRLGLRRVLARMETAA
jgi:hypothetical protein